MSRPHVSRARTLTLMALAMIAVTGGDLLLARSMKTLGAISFESTARLLSLGGQLLATPSFWLSLLCFATFFCLWMAMLSWEELSFLLPLTAVTYLLNAALAGPVLGEQLGPGRWGGTLLIGIGVLLVTLSDPSAPPEGRSGDEVPVDPLDPPLPAEPRSR